MLADGRFEDVVLFDAGEDVEALREHLQGDRLVWLEHREGAALVGVFVRSEPEDVATLLRTVEAWVEERGRLALRFELDGRTFALRSRLAIAAAAEPT